MKIATGTELVDTLRRCGLLEQAQLAEADGLQRRLSDPRSLARELIQRGWLTPYQINQLFQDRAGELILGSYVILERIGEGGMGQVYKARHRKMGRLVALKVIRKDRLTNPDAVRRFDREIRAAAQLSHPNIVTAYDADQVGDTHFYAMEYVEGTDLAKLVKQVGPLPLEQASAYVRQVALGLQHAHEHGMVHRDIKPSNLLLVPREGMVKILDMGLALLPQSNVDDTTPLTDAGAVMGTPDYASPEQARRAHGVDIRADLYSLGCTFYFLLTGRAPFPGGTLSEKLVKHQLDDPEPVEQVRPEVPAGVGAVIRRLMAKPPEDRYQTPGELAAALERGLRTGEWPGTGGAAVTGRFSVPHTALKMSGRMAPVARATSQGARRLGAMLTRAWQSGPVVWARAEIRRRVWEPILRGRWWGLKGAATAGAVVMTFILLWLIWPDFRPPLDRLSASQIPSKDRYDWQPKELVGVLGEHAWRHWGSVRAVGVSPDGKIIATGGEDNAVRLWEASTGREIAAFREHIGKVQAMAFSPDGKTLAAAGDQDVIIRLWDVGQRKIRATLQGHKGPVVSISFAPDGATLASCAQDNTFKFWDATTGQERSSHNRGMNVAFYSVAYAMDGKILAVATGNAGCHLWDVAEGSWRGVIPNCSPQFIAVAPDGKTAAMIQNGARIHLCDLASGQPLGDFPGGGTVDYRSAAFTSDGKMLAVAAADNSVKLMDVSSRREQASLQGHGGPVNAVAALSADTLVSGGDDAAVRFWDLRAVKEQKPLTPSYGLGPFSPDGSLLALRKGNDLVLWDVARRREVETFRGHAAPIRDVVWSSDGKLLATMSSDSLVKIWDRRGKERVSIAPQHTQYMTGISLSADGSMLATTGSREEPVKLWETATGRPKGAVSAGDKVHLSRAVFMPNRHGLVAASTAGGLFIWDDLSSQKPRSLDASRIPGISVMVFSADGRRLAVGDGRGGITLFDVDSGKQLPWPGNAQTYNPLASLAYAADGSMIASCATDNYVSFWDVQTGTKRNEIRYPGPVRDLRFAPDGRHLATGNSNGTIYILRLAPLHGN